MRRDSELFQVEIAKIFADPSYDQLDGLPSEELAWMFVRLNPDYRKLYDEYCELPDYARNQSKTKYDLPNHAELQYYNVTPVIGNCATYGEYKKLLGTKRRKKDEVEIRLKLKDELAKFRMRFFIDYRMTYAEIFNKHKKIDSIFNFSCVKDNLQESSTSITSEFEFIFRFDVRKTLPSQMDYLQAVFDSKYQSLCSSIKSPIDRINYKYLPLFLRILASSAVNIDGYKSSNEEIAYAWNDWLESKGIKGENKPNAVTKKRQAALEYSRAGGRLDLLLAKAKVDLYPQQKK